MREGIKPKPDAHVKQHGDDSDLLMKKRSLELACLDEIGNYIEERPAVPEFLKKLAQILPSAMLNPLNGIVAISYDGLVYGNPSATKLPAKISASLRIQQKFVGAIHIAYMQDPQSIDVESAFLKCVAGRVSGYLENIHLVTEMERQSYELSVLNELSLSLSSRLTLNEIAKVIFEYTAKLMEAADFFVAYYNPATSMVYFPFLHLNGAELASFSRPMGNSLTDYILRNGKPLLLTEDVTNQMKMRGLDIVTVGDDMPALSWLGVPILYEQKVLGVISLQTTQKPGLYTERDQELLMAISRQSAVAIHNALILHQLGERNEELLKFKRGIDQTSDAIFITDIDGVINYMNPAFEKIYGYDEVSTIGQTPRILKSGMIPQEQYQEFWQSLLAGKEVTGEIVNKTKDGRLISIEGTNVPIIDDDRKIIGFLAIHRDITDRKESEYMLQHQLIELESLQRNLSRDAWSAYLSQKQPKKWGYEYNRIEVKSLAYPDSNPTGSGYEYIFAEPLKVRGEVIGEIGVTGDESFILEQEDADFIQSVASQVSQALERARLFEKTQKSALELQTVAQVSSATSTLLEPRELLQSVVDLAKNSFVLYHAHIYLFDEKEAKLVLSSGAGDIGRRMVEEGWEIGLSEESIVAKAARTHQGQIVSDARETPDFLPNPLLPDTLSEIAVPMIVGKKLLGIFDVQSDQPNHFTKEDLQTFTTLASQTAVALQNARLYAEQIVTVERLRELDLLKTSFLANMSHELRTPLNSILGFTQVILEGIDGPLTDYMVSDLQLIEKNGKHLLTLINEVLDMAKIESGKMNLTVEEVDLRELLADILEITSAQAREKEIELLLEIEEETPLEIEADQMRLRQIMINLVGNSIKFTETGRVVVEAKRLQQDIHILVKDTGIGIHPANLETIFEAFSQIDTSTTRKVGGTGLGLPISRKLVELHGGRLWAESPGLGQGATMNLVLPIRTMDNS